MRMTNQLRAGRATAAEHYRRDHSEYLCIPLAENHGSGCDSVYTKFKPTVGNTENRGIIMHAER